MRAGERDVNNDGLDWVIPAKIMETVLLLQQPLPFIAFGVIFNDSITLLK